jgi:hypothetical protein
MRLLMENAHNDMHGFVRMGGVHISFRDPFVFLLHSGQDRIYSRWQTDPTHSERLNGATLYGRESGDLGLNGNVEPWSTGHSIDTFGQEHFTRPWYAPENEGVPHTYKNLSILSPPLYDTNHAYLHWSGDFTGAGKRDVLFWFDDGNWWLGTFTGNQIHFTAAGKTAVRIGMLDGTTH